jgi:hypothetical protein
MNKTQARTASAFNSLLKNPHKPSFRGAAGGEESAFLFRARFLPIASLWVGMTRFRNVFQQTVKEARVGVLALSSVLVFAGLACSPALAWGPRTHVLVTGWAIQTLPPKLRGYFGAYSQDILQHVNDPDRWMKKDRFERLRHYIFLDSYGRFPYRNLPHSYKAAVAQYGAKRVGRAGTLPWQIGEFSLRLTNDLREQKWDQARKDAAVLGYYVADAHDPLNTTENYDGQLTGETGLATRFGVDLIGRFQNFILYRSQPAAKIEDPTEHAFQTVIEAHTWVDSILLADTASRDDLPNYNDDYYDRFYTAVSSLVMHELTAAANDIGSYWYTAWLNAGQPAPPGH